MRSTVSLPVPDATPADLLTAVDPRRRPDLVEVAARPDGKIRYRIRGMVMAWCDSVGEAVRVANILIRAGRPRGLALD